MLVLACFSVEVLKWEVWVQVFAMQEITNSFIDKSQIKDLVSFTCGKGNLFLNISIFTLD
jgi:hypothetical protein